MDKAFDPVKILQEETKKSTLFFVGLDFYKDADEFIRELERDLDTTAPDSTKHAITELRLSASKESIETILSHRLRKIIKQAQIDIFERGKSASEALTLEENELYQALLSLVGSWKSQHIDPVLNKKVIKTITTTEDELIKETLKDRDKIKTDLERSNKKEYTTVRVLLPVPTFIGIDSRSYSLQKEDVVTLPSVNANGLINKKVAVEILTFR